MVGQLSDWTVPVGAPAYLVAPVMERVTAPAETRGCGIPALQRSPPDRRDRSRLAEQFALWKD